MNKPRNPILPKPHEINIPNNLIFSPQNFDIVEKRLLYLCLAKIKSAQKPLEPLGQLQLFSNNGEQVLEGEYPSSLRTLTLGYAEATTHSAWDAVKEAVKKFEKRSIQFKYEDRENPKKSFEETINLVERCRRTEGSGIKIVFTNPGYHLLTHLSKSYTQTPLELILLLNSKYSQRIYELLLSRCYGKDFGEWTVNLETFRNLLGIGPGQYLHWGSLEKATIKKAKHELSLSDIHGIQIIPLHFDYTPIKKSGKTVAISFQITNVSTGETFKSDSYTAKQLRLLEMLEKIGMAEKHRHEIVTKHETQATKWSYNRQFLKTDYNNPAGHLLKTLGLK